MTHFVVVFFSLALYLSFFLFILKKLEFLIKSIQSSQTSACLKKALSVCFVSSISNVLNHFKSNIYVTLISFY